MPRGGKRVGAGRKPKAEAHRIAQENALTPVEMTPANTMPRIVRPSYEQIRTLEQGESPVDMMLSVARHHMREYLAETQKRRPSEKRMNVHLVLAREAAKAAAPYCSPRLAAIRHSGSVNSVTWNADMLMAVMAKLPDGELQNLERIFALVAAAAGPAASDPGHDPAATPQTGS